MLLGIVQKIMGISAKTTDRLQYCALSPSILYPRTALIFLLHLVKKSHSKDFVLSVLSDEDSRVEECQALPQEPVAFQVLSCVLATIFSRVAGRFRPSRWY